MLVCYKRFASCTTSLQFSGLKESNRLFQAKRIQNLFDDMKSANSELPAVPKSQPPVVLKAEFDSKTIKQSAEEVAETIFAALKNNNSPAPNHGLKVLSCSI